MKRRSSQSKDGIVTNELFYEEPEEPVFDIEKAVPVECPKGSVVLLDGSLVHYSHHNHSEEQRHALTLHFVES